MRGADPSAAPTTTCNVRCAASASSPDTTSGAWSRTASTTTTESAPLTDSAAACINAPCADAGATLRPNTRCSPSHPGTGADSSASQVTSPPAESRRRPSRGWPPVTRGRRPEPSTQ